MPILEMALMTLVIVMLAVVGFSVRLFFSKDKQVRGGSCQATHPPDLRDNDLGCGCGNGSCTTQTTS